MAFEFSNLPTGLSVALLMNEQAQTGFQKMTEAEKERFILECRDAKSKSEMDRLIDSISPADNLKDLFDGPGIG